MMHSEMLWGLYQGWYQDEESYNRYVGSNNIHSDSWISIKLALEYPIQDFEPDEDTYLGEDPVLIVPHEFLGDYSLEKSR